MNLQKNWSMTQAKERGRGRCWIIIIMTNPLLNDTFILCWCRLPLLLPLPLNRIPTLHLSFYDSLNSPLLSCRACAFWKSDRFVVTVGRVILRWEKMVCLVLWDSDTLSKDNPETIHSRNTWKPTRVLKISVPPKRPIFVLQKPCAFCFSLLGGTHSYCSWCGFPERKWFIPWILSGYDWLLSK